MSDEIRIHDLAHPELNDIQRMGIDYGETVHTELTVDWLDGPTHTLHAASPYLGAAARAGSASCRCPAAPRNCSQHS